MRNSPSSSGGPSRHPAGHVFNNILARRDLITFWKPPSWTTHHKGMSPLKIGTFYNGKLNIAFHSTSHSTPKPTQQQHIAFHSTSRTAFHSTMPQYTPQCHSTVHSTVPFHSTSAVPGHSTWNRTGGPEKIILITFLRAGPKTTPTTDHVMTMSSIRRSVGQVPTNSTFWLLFSHYS